MGDFYDLCLFRMYEESHLARDVLDVSAQALEILFVRMQDDTVIHIRIIAMQLPDGLAVRVDTCWKENPCDLREW